MIFEERKDFLPVSKPTLGDAELEAVVDTLKSGWITTGPRAELFEKRFAEFTGAKYALALSSATAGLHIGLIALGFKPGDEVITTPMTWAATVNMIEVLGGRPVFVDIDSGTLQIDTSKVAVAVTERTVGILPVHFGGAPCDLQALKDIATSKGLWLFEDAAHGVGTEYAGRHVGTEGALGVFSFHPIKNMTSIEGGMLTLDDAETAARLKALRFHGLEKSAWNRYAEGGTPQVQVVVPGFKYNFTDVQAAIALCQLDRVDDFNRRRRELAGLYDSLLAEVDEIGRPSGADQEHTHTWHLYVVKVLDSAGLARDELMAALNRRGVGTGLHFRAVHTQPYYAQKYPEWLDCLPNAEWASERICSLPMFPTMTDQDVEYVVSAIKDVLAQRS